MNKRIRKKKAKQQLIRAISGLVEAAEEMQREQERRTRQAGISYIKYGIMQMFRSQSPVKASNQAIAVRLLLASSL